MVDGEAQNPQMDRNSQPLDLIVKYPRPTRSHGLIHPTKLHKYIVENVKGGAVTHYGWRGSPKIPDG